MAGIEILVVMIGLLGAGVGALAATAVVGERRKHRFVAEVAAAIAERVDDVESGDLVRPLAFRIGSVHVQAAVRGDVEVWQLEVTGSDAERDDDAENASVGAGTLAIVYSGWRAPDARDLTPVSDLGSRFFVFADDEERGRRFLARTRSDLAFALGRHTRRMVVGRGRMFLEVTRGGLLWSELADALARFEAVRAVIAGRRPLLPLQAPSSEHAIAGPGGVPIPAV